MLRSAPWGIVWSVLRALVAVAIVAAIVAQAISTFGFAVADGLHVATTVANFFSFFTILSNLATAIVLGWAVVFALSHPRGVRDPRPLAVALVCVTTYMSITGVVYNLLLRDTFVGPDTVGWSNEILHVWAPLFLVADLFLAPRRRGLRWSAAVAALAFPLVWVVYTFVRAPLITNPRTGDPRWYPYPFLDPQLNPGDWLGVWAYVLGIAVAIIAVAFAVVAIGRFRAGGMSAVYRRVAR
jgi:hypothetical protein